MSYVSKTPYPNRFWRQGLRLLFFVPLLIACTATRPAADAGLDPAGLTIAAAEPTQLAGDAPLAVPISIYILDDENDALSSQRTAAELEAIYGRVNDIWAPAAIRLDVRTIARVTVPNVLLQGIARGDFFSFFNAVNSGQIILPELSAVAGFYVRDLGGPNGINPASSSTFFVMDTPSVHDERVSAHELGHIFGLHHVLDDAGRLLFSGTNGTALSEEEVVVARYGAQGLLQGLR